MVCVVVFVSISCCRLSLVLFSFFSSPSRKHLQTAPLPPAKALEQPAAKGRGRCQRSRWDLYCAVLCYDGLPLTPRLHVTPLPVSIVYIDRDEQPERVCRASISVIYPEFEPPCSLIRFPLRFFDVGVVLVHRAILIISLFLSLGVSSLCTLFRSLQDLELTKAFYIYCGSVLPQSPDPVDPSKLACIFVPPSSSLPSHKPPVPTEPLKGGARVPKHNTIGKNKQTYVHVSTC